MVACRALFFSTWCRHTWAKSVWSETKPLQWGQRWLRPDGDRPALLNMVTGLARTGLKFRPLDLWSWNPKPRAAASKACSDRGRVQVFCVIVSCFNSCPYSQDLKLFHPQCPTASIHTCTKIQPLSESQASDSQSVVPRPAAPTPWGSWWNWDTWPHPRPAAWTWVGGTTTLGWQSQLHHAAITWGTTPRPHLHSSHWLSSRQMSYWERRWGPVVDKSYGVLRTLIVSPGPQCQCSPARGQGMWKGCV
jgi:hypothetical protein